ncbi:hypothetical protein D3C77_299770 [compost metagenome]
MDGCSQLAKRHILAGLDSYRNGIDKQADNFIYIRYGRRSAGYDGAEHDVLRIAVILQNDSPNSLNKTAHRHLVFS